MAAFDITKSHGLILLGIIHNEAQDGKTELDSSFFHFKYQLHKYASYYKGSVLTPSDMGRAMSFGRGLQNSRFDIVLFDRNHLDALFDDKGKYYGVFKDRMKHVFPTNIAEVRTNNITGVNEIYESSVLPPFEFNNNTVKKIDKYMNDMKDQFFMGYNFFKTLCEANSKNEISIPTLPTIPQNELMTKTEIIETVFPPDEVRMNNNVGIGNIVDDGPEIELADIGNIVDDGPEIELADIGNIVDDGPEIELADREDNVVDDGPEIELADREDNNDKAAEQEDKDNDEPEIELADREDNNDKAAEQEDKDDDEGYNSSSSSSSSSSSYNNMDDRSVDDVNGGNETGNGYDSDYEHDFFYLNYDEHDNNQVLACERCGRICSSEYHLRKHYGSNACSQKKLNMSVEARAIRLLQKGLYEKEIVVHEEESDVVYLSPETKDSIKKYGLGYFPKGWARRRAHGKTKGHTYMTDEYKQMIQKYFEEGEKDKGKKKSPAMMVEAMYSDLKKNGYNGQHPHKKHYVPFISEVTVVVNQCSTTTKKKKPSSSESNIN